MRGEVHGPLERRNGVDLRSAPAARHRLGFLLCALIAAACSGDERAQDRSREAGTAVQASAAAASPSDDVRQEAWRAEMERELDPPSLDLSIEELAGRIAFASTRNGPHTIFTQTLARGSEPQRILYGSEPAWSPDGISLAFARSYLDTGDEIAVMNADGSNVRQLTGAEGQDRGPNWSPDGRRIAFWSERDQGQREIYVVDLDGGQLQRLTSDEFADMWPSWSPDGNEIVYETYRDDGAALFAVSRSGGRPRRITPVDLDAREPQWSPDGSQIAFISSTGDGWALAVIAPDGTGVRKVAEMKGIRNPAWSPDGRFLIFACMTPDSPNEDVCVVDVAGRRMMNVTNDGGGFDWEPSWTR